MLAVYLCFHQGQITHNLTLGENGGGGGGAFMFCAQCCFTEDVATALQQEKS